MEIKTPKEFSFYECLRYLGRSDLEPLHQIEQETLFKIVEIDDYRIPISVTSSEHTLSVHFLAAMPTQAQQRAVRHYIKEWLDFDSNLSEFYKLAGNDRILASLVSRFYGLRLIKILSLFQAMTWL